MNKGITVPSCSNHRSLVGFFISFNFNVCVPDLHAEVIALGEDACPLEAKVFNARVPNNLSRQILKLSYFLMNRNEYKFRSITRLEMDSWAFLLI